MQKIYKGAIIGCGLIADYHARAYKFIENVTLHAVCDVNPKAAKRLAKNYNIPNVYKNAIKLLKNKSIDFVEILTPHSSHLELTTLALRHNKHINLQKVPTVNLDEFNKMKKLIRENEQVIRIFENFRYYEPYTFSKQLIKDNTIGKVQIVNITKYGGLKNSLAKGFRRLQSYKWRLSKSDNHKHPTIFDDGYHKHSLIEYFLGETVTKVRGWCKYNTVIPGIKIDSPIDIHYYTKNNKLGKFQSANIKIRIENNFYPCDEIIEIIGRSGIIKIFGGHGLLFNKEHDSQIKQGVHWMGRNSKWNINDKLNLDIRDSFVKGLEKFIQSLNGKKDSTFTLSDAENSLKIGLGIIKSLEYNKAIHID
ncbi:hypothetical protein GF362_06005 [Candidatus Dojkabacteria bacterium]|nr:hypothetical protein [Candidatus Dojkabacteria bacterium]